MLVYVAIGATYGFAAAVQPGPFQTYLVSQALTVGWRRTIPSTFAPPISDIPAAVLVLLVLSQLPVWFEPVLHIAGGLFVLYLAFGAFQSWRRFNPEPTGTRPIPQYQSVWRAVTVNVLNPNPYIGWSLVMGPLLMQAWREHPSHGVALLGAFYSTLIACTIGIVMLFAFARRLGPKVDRLMIGLSSLALAGFGIYQLWMGIA